MSLEKRKQTFVKGHSISCCCVRVFIFIENTFQKLKRIFLLFCDPRVYIPPSDRSKLFSSARLSILTKSLSPNSNPLRSKSNFQNLDSHIKIQTFEELVRSLNLNFKFPHSPNFRTLFLKKTSRGCEIFYSLFLQQNFLRSQDSDKQILLKQLS